MKIEGNVDILSLIQKFQQGVKAWPQVKFVFAPVFRISLAGLLGVAGLIFTLRDGNIRNFSCSLWSSGGQKSFEKLWIVPGLQNFGNNCFLNVILQALASCSGFQTFLKASVEECESSLGGEWAEGFPLTFALVSLMEGLCNVQHERVVLNPRKLMLVMSHYISNFNLASQQDAEEVFFHILSSLREEFSSCYAPVHISLADVIACPNCRILSPNRRLEESEQQKWLRSFLGPFDGILGSNITCESCSFQISLDFQFFHSLHLLPLLDTGADIIPGCSLEDCLRQFFTAERLENYYCSHCWHVAAIKYLSLKDENEIYIAKLRQCSEQGSCDCRTLPFLEALPWSNSFSHTFKQLSIARSPKILCIHVQRASMNKFGELIKLEGHISFPLILNLNPFMKTGMRTKEWEENLQALQGKQQYQSQYPSNFYLQVDATLNGIYERMGKGFPLKAVNTAELTGMSSKMSGNNHGEAFEGEEQSVPQIGDFSDILSGDTLVQFDNKVGGICPMASEELHTYCLVSVVQHFGRASSGHYTVYRSVRTKNDGDPVGPSEHSLVHWFCISDAEVYSVSEEDVLAAEASVLFYEKIS